MANKSKTPTIDIITITVFIVIAVALGVASIAIIANYLSNKEPYIPVNPDPVDPPVSVMDPTLYEYALSSHYYSNSSNDAKHQLIHSQDELDNYLNLLQEETDWALSKSYAGTDFNNYDYLAYIYNFDDCSEYNIFLSGFDVDANSIELELSYSTRCGVCALESGMYLIPIEKNLVSDQYTFNESLNVVDEEYCDPGVAYKPVIYLYPENETELEVRFSNPEKLTTTYPKYSDSWKVVASPNGKLVDVNTGRELYALYWEGTGYTSGVRQDGFVVSGEDSASFLEEKLAQIGLNEREAEEFIIYWLPKLESSKYNYIHFELTDEIDNYMPLELSTKPDTKIRVIMSFKALDAPIDVEEQDLGNTPSRAGFTLVEWGGHEIK